MPKASHLPSTSLTSSLPSAISWSMWQDRPMVPTMMGFFIDAGSVLYFMKVFFVTALRSDIRQSMTVTTTSASWSS